MPMPRLQLIGKRFGHLRVTAFIQMATGHRSRWRCVCDCGKRCVLLAGNRHRARSCGCIPGNFRHGHAYDGKTTREYHAWVGMLQRCTNRRSPKWKDYGGRGIKVCARWRDFRNFLADMGLAPKGKTLDRRINSGDYAPRNCRWATPKQQAINRRERRA